MATSGLDLSLQLNASQRGLSEIQADVSSLVQQFHNATRAIGQVGDLSQLSGESLRQMAQYGQQSLSRLETELAAARLELNRLAATNATPTDIENARKRVEQLTRAVDQTRTAVGAYEDAARAAMETPPVPTDFQRRVGSLVNQLENVGRTLDENGNSATHTRQQLEQLATQATEQLRRYEQQLHDARLELNRLSATSASPADIERARSRVQELERGVSQVSSSLDGYRSRARIANNEVASSTNRATESVDRLRSSYGALRTTVTTLAVSLAALGVGLSARELLETSDATQQMASRLKNATDSTQEYNLVQQRLLELANSTYRPLSEAQEVYLATAGTMKSLGYSTEQILSATESLSLSFTANATRADQAQSAQDAFAGALAKGSVDADAWMSILTGADNVVSDMAKSTGRTESEIRKLGASGTISINELTDALIKSRDHNKALADAMENSTADAMQKVKNNITALVGQMNEQYHISSRLADVIQNLGGNLDWMTVLVDDAISAIDDLSANFGEIDPSVFDALKQAISSAYDAFKTLGGTVIELTGNGLKNLNTLFDLVSNTLGSFVGVSTEADEQVGFLTRTIQGISIGLGFFQDGLTAVTILSKAMTGVMFTLASAANSVLASLTWGDVSKQFTANAAVLKAEAKKYYREAQNDAINFESQGVKQMSLASRTKDQIRQDELQAAKDKYEQMVQGSTESEGRKLAATQAYAQAAIEANNGVLSEQLKNELATKGYAVAVDEAGKVTVTAMGNAANATSDAAKKAEAVRVATENLKKADEAYLQFQKTAAIERAILEKQIEEAKRTGNLNALKDAQDKSNAIDAKERELLGNRNARAQELNQINASSAQSAKLSYTQASAAAQKFGLDIDVAMNKVTSDFKASGQALDTLRVRLPELGATGQQTSQALYEGWQKWLSTAKDQAELDAAKAKLEEFGKAGVLSTRQVDAGLLAIKQRNAEVAASTDPVIQAFEALGIKTKEQLALSAQQSLASFNTILSSGKATASGLKSAYEQVMQAAVASGDQAVIAAAKSKAAQAGLSVEVSNTGDVTVQTTREIVDAMSSVDGATTRASGGFKDLGDSATEQANRVSDAWDSAADSVGKAAKAGEKVTASNLWLTQDYIAQQLKSKGYDDAKAQSLAKQIYDQTKGQSNIGAAYASRDYYLSHGYTDSMYTQMRTGSKNLSNYAAVDEQLQKYADLAAQKSKTTTDTTSSAAANINNSTGTTRTIKIEAPNGTTATVTAPQSQADTLEEIFSTLGRHKKSS